MNLWNLQGQWEPDLAATHQNQSHGDITSDVAVVSDWLSQSPRHSHRSCCQHRNQTELSYAPRTDHRRQNLMLGILPSDLEVWGTPACQILVHGSQYSSGGMKARPSLALSSLLEMTRPYLPTFLGGREAPPKRKQKKKTHWDVGAPGMVDIH